MPAITTVRAALEIYRAIKTYGPVVKEIVGDLVKLEQSLVAFFDQHQDHMQLTEAERRELLLIISEDPTKIGMPPDVPREPDTPVATVPDPTAERFPSLEEAKAAWEKYGKDPADNPFVVIDRSDDALYQLFPKSIGPTPGAQAWPERF